MFKKFLVYKSLAFFICSSISLSFVSAVPITEQQINNIKVHANNIHKKLNLLGIFNNDYSNNIPENKLNEYFKKMSCDRWKMYFTNPEDYNKPGAFGKYKEEFKTPENYKNWNSRYNFPMAFSYNLASLNYNASIIESDKYIFLAIEAPSEQNSSEFCSLMEDNKNQIGLFVRLNVPDEYPDENYFPYWETWNICKLVSYNWKHRSGTSVNSLLDLINNIKNLDLKNKMICVSCRAGCGRTGTFIASYILIKQIDDQLKNGIDKKNIKLNIDDIVWHVCIQRPFAITHLSQYVMLYRLVDLYINQLTPKEEVK